MDKPNPSPSGASAANARSATPGAEAYGTTQCPHCGRQTIHQHSLEELSGPKCPTCQHILSLHSLGRLLGWTRVAGSCGFVGCSCNGDNRDSKTAVSLAESAAAPRQPEGPDLSDAATLGPEGEALRLALTAVLPFAESRAEDMSEEVEVTPEEWHSEQSMEEAISLRDKAWAAVSRARAVLRRSGRQMDKETLIEKLKIEAGLSKGAAVACRSHGAERTADGLEGEVRAFERAIRVVRAAFALERKVALRKRAALNDALTKAVQ